MHDAFNARLQLMHGLYRGFGDFCFYVPTLIRLRGQEEPLDGRRVFLNEALAGSSVVVLSDSSDCPKLLDHYSIAVASAIPWAARLRR